MLPVERAIALLFSSLALAAPLAACHATEIDVRAEAKLAESRTVAERRILYATCTDGAGLGAGCGLLTRVAGTDAFRAKFRDKVCEQKTREACQEAYERMIDAELERRYRFADHAAVDSECRLHPGRCDDGVAYEKLLMTSHNANVQATSPTASTRKRRARRSARCSRPRPS